MYSSYLAVSSERNGKFSLRHAAACSKVHASLDVNCTKRGRSRLNSKGAGLAMNLHCRTRHIQILKEYTSCSDVCFLIIAHAAGKLCQESTFAKKDPMFSVYERMCVCTYEFKHTRCLSSSKLSQ